MPRRTAAGIVGLAALLASGCQDSVSGPADPPRMSLAPVRGGPPPTLDEAWAALADGEIPGFAGHVLNADGSSVVFLARPASAEAARAHVLRFRRARGLGEGQVHVRPAAYDFRQLKTWADRLAPVLDEGAMVLLDIDEAQNRIVLGVADAGSIQRARREVVARDVPPAVVEVRVVERPEHRNYDLRSEFRPVVGGIGTINAVTAECTLGYVAIYTGSWYDPQSVPGFLTNSHCSKTKFGLDGSAQYQPESRLAFFRVGTEYLDPPRQTCDAVWGICFTRSSDASFFQLTAGVSYEVGKIARPQWAAIGSPGPIVVDAAAPRFSITTTAWQEETVVGTWLNKVGRETGWTRGQVTQTCVLLSGITCNYVTNIHSQRGDSGSPIFADQSTGSVPSGLEVKAHGMLWGGPPTNFNVTYFSHMAGISNDMGFFTVCVPGSYC